MIDRTPPSICQDAWLQSPDFMPCISCSTPAATKAAAIQISVVSEAVTTPSGVVRMRPPNRMRTRPRASSQPQL